MNESWQSIAALGVVALTAGIFLWKSLRGRKSGCGTGCDCPKAGKAGLPK
jgi:hypothetical protein